MPSCPNRFKYMVQHLRATIGIEDKIPEEKKPGDKKLPLITSRSFDTRAMQWMIIACTLMAAWAILVDYADATERDAANSLDEIAVTSNSEAATDNLSYNSSTIRLESQNNNTRAPVSFSVGNGYYSSHPVTYNSAIGSQTQLVNKGESASMHHAVQSAQGISGSAEYTVTGRSSRQGDSEYASTTSAQMRIDETVTDGRVHIGVLQGDEAPGGVAGRDGRGPMTSAWKNPAIEIEEDYIGTYHISKNITISKSDRRLMSTDSWLNCCGNYLDFYPAKPVSISADDVFNCNSPR